MRGHLAMLVAWAWLAGGARGDGPGPAADRYGDPLPEGAVARLGFVRRGSSVPLNIADGPLAAFAPDGKRFASVCHDRVYLWDVATGRVKHRLHSPKGAIIQVRFAADGKRLLAQDVSGCLHAWEVATGRAAWKDIPEMYLWGPAHVSPGGRWLIDARGDLWDLPAAKRLRQFNEARRGPAAFSADERSLFVARRGPQDGGDGPALEQWDVAAGKRLREVPGFAASSLACTPDGRAVAAARLLPHARGLNKHAFTLVVFDVAAGRELFRLPEGDVFYYPPVFSADGKQLAALDQNGVLHLWDTRTGKTLRTWKYGPDRLPFLAFSPDGRRLGACGHGGTALLWDVGTGEARVLCGGLLGRVSALAFSRDGERLVSGHADGSVRVWDVAGQRTERVFPLGESAEYPAVPFLAWADDPGRLLFQRPKGGFALLDLETGEARPISPGKGVEVRGVSADGRTLFLGPPLPGKHDLGWKPLTPAQVRAAQDEVRRQPGLKSLRAIPLVPAQDRVPGALPFLDRGESRPVPTSPEVISDDGRYVVEAVMTVAGSPNTGLGTYWAVKGRRLAEMTTGRVLRDLPAGFHHLVFAPDGRSLLAWSDREKKPAEVVQLESRTGGERWRVALDKPVSGVAFSPCGQWLAVTEIDGEALLFLDAITGKTVAERRVERLYNGSERLAFSPDSKFLARACGDGTILLWALPDRPSARPAELTANQLAEAWRDLAGPDAGKAFTALLRLADAPDRSLPLLRKELLRPDERGRVEKLVADLNAPGFADRQRATRDLQALGVKARPVLAKALRPDTPLEPRRRMQTLLAALADPFATPEGLRQLRGVEVLERIASPEARRLLEELADGSAEDDPLGLEARLTLSRLRGRLGHTAK